MIISIMVKNNLVLKNTNWLVFGMIIIGGFYLQDAYAYIDAGSGSVVIQVIIGALVGVGVTLKMYWYKLKEKFSGKLKRNQK